MPKAYPQNRLRRSLSLHSSIDARRSRIIGSAVEINGGFARERPCYGTYHGDIPDTSFRFNITVVKHQGAFPVHSHEYAELVIVLSGRATHLTNCGNHLLEDGDVVVINRHTRHGFSDARDLVLCNIMYDPVQFLSGHRDLDQMMGYHVLFDLEPRSNRSEFKERLHLSTEELVYVTSLISTLKGEYDSQNDGRKTCIRCTFLLLVTHLSRLYARQKQQTGTALVRMANVISYIQTHFREPLPLEDLARLAHWSPSQFRRNFKRIYNTSPIRFIFQVRLHEACEMLKDPNRDITDVAMESGFSSSSFFATQFRNHLGESPSQYRRRKLSELSLQQRICSRWCENHCNDSAKPN
jgi:AraC-like DNA-binding protein/mannose-6-phosphate isomerase-like protein (cupin superfamily)